MPFRMDQTNEMQQLRDWQPYCRYASCSRQLQFVFDNEDSRSSENTNHVLSIFQAEAISSVSKDVTEGSGKWNACSDILLYTGGPVWSLDWCPERPSWRTWRSHVRHHEKEFLAVGAHPVCTSGEKFPEPLAVHHKLGEPLSGKGLVQIWGFSFAVKSDSSSAKLKSQPTTSINVDQHSTTCMDPRRLPQLRKESMDSQGSGIIGNTGGLPFINENSESNYTAYDASLLHGSGNAEHLLLSNISDLSDLDGIVRLLHADRHHSQSERPEQSKKDMELGVGKTFYGSDTLEAHNINDACLDEGFCKTLCCSAGGSSLPPYTEDEKALTKHSFKLKDMARGKGLETPGTAPSFGESYQKLNVSGNQSPARMILGIVHEGEVAWDLKWQPVGDILGAVTDNGEALRLGILAVVLGDGSLQVFDVPNPSVIKNSGRRKARDDLAIMRIDPVFKCSDLQSGGHKSIPLTVEWSTSKPHDKLLAACHDGNVAVWKFIQKSSHCSETRPIMFFTADSLPLRTIAWAPDASDSESQHIIATGGHSGCIRFWDIRDPFRPIWEIHLSRGCVLKMDWLVAPRCLLLAMDDGTVRILSLNKIVSETPATGLPFPATQAQGVQSYLCSSFAIWDIHVSRKTGMVAYGGADGSVLRFELTEKAVDKGGKRYREPHYPCGAFSNEHDNETIMVVSPFPVASVDKETFSGVMRKSKRGSSAASNQAMRDMYKSSVDDPVAGGSAGKTRKWHREPFEDNSCSDLIKSPLALTPYETQDMHEIDDMPLALCNIGTTGDPTFQKRKRKGSSRQRNSKGSGFDSNIDPIPSNHLEKFPRPLVAIHRIRWNCNEGSKNWICYGGSAGIIRCQQLPFR